MADNNFNLIKPVENLQNVAGVTPTKRREERKQKQQMHKQNEQQDEELNEQTDERPLEEESLENENGTSTIDYCA